MAILKGSARALVALVLGLAGVGQAEFQVNTYVEHQQTDPAVAMNDAGDFAVVWRSHAADGRGGGVYGRCFRADGTAAGPEFKVNTSEVDVASWTPAVAMSAEGSFVVTWVSRDCDIYARKFDAEGLPLTEEFAVCDMAREGILSAPVVSMNSAGAFVVAWTCWYGERYIGENHVAARVFNADGAPASDAFLASEVPNAEWPDVAMDEAGRFVLTWIQMGDTHNRPYGEYIIFRQYAADGTPAGAFVQVTGDLNSRWYGPSVAVDHAGAFALAWAIGPFPYDVCAQSFDAVGTPVTAPYVVNTCMEGNQGHPCIASNGHGDYRVAWDSQGRDGSGCGVCSQQCTGDGELTGCEEVLNTCVQGRQWYPDAAMAADGRYVVVWISEDQDGSGYGIFGRIGAPASP